ncbi:MAG: zf-HC2 domain-containing protein [Chloroflexia bacterium]
MVHELFDELMSLKLDGLIDELDDRRLDEHLGECELCARAWLMLRQTHVILRNSASEPLPVPSSFHSKVMAQVAAPTPQPQTAQPTHSKPLLLPATSTGRLGDTPSLQGVGVPAFSAHTRRLPYAPTIGLNDNTDWQRQVVGYLRNAGAIIVALAGMAALFLALTMSGVIKLGGALGEGISTLRTLFEAVGAWFQSLFATSGSALIAASAVIAGLLLLAGWQVITTYQRAVLEGRGHTGALTGALNTGPLEVAA